MGKAGKRGKGHSQGCWGILGVIPSLNPGIVQEHQRSSEPLPTSFPTIPYPSLDLPLAAFPSRCGSQLSQQENQHFLQEMEFPWHRHRIPARTCKSVTSPFPKILKNRFFISFFSHEFISNFHWAPRFSHKGMTKIYGILGGNKNPSILKH